MNAVLLANGPITDYDALKQVLPESPYVVACDGGLIHAKGLNLKPDCIIGDMDSVPSALLADYVENGIAPHLYPRDKDETDLSLGMAHALSKNPASITVLGATGGRFDHAMANIHVLAAPLEQGVPAAMADENACIMLVRSHCRLPRGVYETVTLIPFTAEVTGITTQGLAYPLRGETLRLGTTRGVSNRFVSDEAVLTVADGILLVILYKEM